MTEQQHSSEILTEGKQVFTACAFIHKKISRENAVFLARRAMTKKFLPGVYELPGGHVDYGEDLQDGLRRELHEELKLDVDIGEVAGVFTYVNEVKRSHSIEVVYFATLITGENDIHLNPEDHSEYVWATESVLLDVVKSGGKDETDPEYLLIKKGFRLLELYEEDGK
jgi:ADP-ribose pyrophosphatase YjhB (NUDIX family)